MAGKENLPNADRSHLHGAGDDLLDPESMDVRVYYPPRRKRRMGITMWLAVLAIVCTALAIYLHVTKEDPKAEEDVSPAETASETIVNEVVVDVDKVNEAAGAEENAGKDEKKAEGAEQTIEDDSIVGRMVKVLSGYFGAKTLEEKMQYVIDPQRVEPLMYNYYSRTRYAPQEIRELTPPRSFSIDGAAFWRTRIVLGDGSVAFAAMRVIDGEPKIDWESQVRFSSYDWTNWVDDKSIEEGDFRVYAVLDQYYPAPFSDSSRYMCVKLTTMDSPRSMFAYLDRKDPAQRDLIMQLSSGGKQECTLRLQQVASEAASPVAKVTKVLSASWIIVEKDS